MARAEAATGVANRADGKAVAAPRVAEWRAAVQAASVIRVDWVELAAAAEETWAAALAMAADEAVAAARQAAMWEDAVRMAAETAKVWLAAAVVDFQPLVGMAMAAAAEARVEWVQTAEVGAAAIKVD